MLEITYLNTEELIPYARNSRTHSDAQVSQIMGIPQKRERVFFICQRKDLNLPRLKLEFSESKICIKDFYTTIKKEKTENYKESRFGDVMINLNDCCNTIVTINRYLANENELLSKQSIQQIGAYPLDYDFQDVEPKYLIGMSVPPVMTAQIANQIKIQWLDKIKAKQCQD